MYTDVSVPFLSPVFPFYQIEFHPRTWKEPKNSKWGRGDMFMMPLVYQIQFSAFCRSYFRRPCSLTISSLLNLLWHILADIGHWLYIYMCLYIERKRNPRNTSQDLPISKVSWGNRIKNSSLLNLCLLLVEQSSNPCPTFLAASHRWFGLVSWPKCHPSLPSFRCCFFLLLFFYCFTSRKSVLFVRFYCCYE